MFKIHIRKWVEHFFLQSFFSVFKYYHPVQHRWKAHKGTDYAAPRSHNYASGTVIRTGYTAGNGNYVKVKHNNTYSTQYCTCQKSWFDVVNM
jgi:murein DD-endopeptidase MepM/ murein hydrolase activator NlpD